MNVATAALLSVGAISLISLSGIAFLSLNERTLKKILLELVAFSVGALLGGVFLHILPELSEELGFTVVVSFLILAGFLFGFLLEKFVHWHHCHNTECHHETRAEKRAHDEHMQHHTKPFAFLNIIGDAIHNFVDGILIAAAYLVSIPLGLATTVAVLLHEIPQEIGDFAVLIHAGWSRAKALLMNFLSALAAVLGAGLTLLFGSRFAEYVPYVLPIAAGLFLYLAAADLVPELQKETKAGKSVVQLLALLAGIAVMAALLLFE